MEDAHATVLKLDPHSGNAFFAVFDGHGGVYGQPWTHVPLTLSRFDYCKVCWFACPRKTQIGRGIPEQGLQGSSEARFSRH